MIMTARQALEPCLHPQSFFALIIFRKGLIFFAWGILDLTYHVAGKMGMYHHTWLILLRWNLTNIFLRLALNCDPSHLCLQSSWDYRQEGIIRTGLRVFLISHIGDSIAVCNLPTM
jgi:hypothetical protein